MSTSQSFADIPEPEQAILGALESAEKQIERRVDLADVTEESYPPHERTLINKGWVKEVGKDSTRNEAGEQVVYRRLALTEDGERALRRIERATEPEQEPDPVEPKTRRRSREPWHKRAEWTDLSPDVNQILDATRSVAFDADEDMVLVTLDRADREATLEFNKVSWFNTGHRKFAEQYHAAFSERNPIDEREFGILQALWIERYAEQDAEPKTAKERAIAYLDGDGAGDSIREAADHLDCSVGTVQSARQELNGED